MTATRSGALCGAERVLLYYSNLKRNPKMLLPILASHRENADREGLGFVAVVPDVPMAAQVPADVFVPDPGGPTHAERIVGAILAGAEACDPGAMVYLAEDDCVYHSAHFAPAKRWALPTDPEKVWRYDMNAVHLCRLGYFERYNRASLLLSHSCGRARVLVAYMRRKMEEVRAGDFTCYEPAGGSGYETNHWMALYPSLDLRHGANTTWSPDYGASGDCFYHDEPGWPPALEMIERLGLGEG